MRAPLYGFAISALTLSLVACGGNKTEAKSENEAKPAEEKKHEENPDWWHSQIEVANKSDYAILKLYLTPHDANEWGPDQLQEDILAKNETLVLKGIECNSYDVKLVDKDGDECIVKDVDLCLKTERWEMTTEALVGCQALTSSGN